LQGHPEAGSLWEEHINKILDDLDIVYTRHERSIYRGTIQVDDLYGDSEQMEQLSEYRPRCGLNSSDPTYCGLWRKV
jgi:hypothetical protein